jgi:hypothetical protein
MEWILIGIIITLVVAGILFVVVKIILDNANEAASRKACETSVDIRAKGKIAGHTLLSNLECETYNMTIDSTNEEIIKNQIATEMFSCWNMFGEGKVDFLSDNDFGKGDNWCHICSRIDFNDKVQKEVPKLNDFDQYLKDTEIPIIGKTFYEHIYSLDNSKVIDPLPEGIDISTDESTYVVFFGDKRKDFWEDIDSIDKTEATTLLVSCWAGAKGGAAAGAIYGTIVNPGLGSALGGVAGAVMGCGSGMLVGYTAEATIRKTDYVSALYVGNSNEVIKICGQ